MHHYWNALYGIVRGTTAENKAVVPAIWRLNAL